jgi:hypothetical protein
VNYYALNLNLRIFVDILTMILDAVEFLALRLLMNDTVYTSFVMFCSVKWRVVDWIWEFLNSSITDMRLVWHRRHKSKRFIFDPWDISKMWCASVQILFCKWCHFVQIFKIHFFVDLKLPKIGKVKKENSIPARLCVFAELSETTTCVKITSNCYSHAINAIIDLFAKQLCTSLKRSSLL